MMNKDLGFSGDQVFQINFKKTNFIDEKITIRGSMNVTEIK